MRARGRVPRTHYLRLGLMGATSKAREYLMEVRDQRNRGGRPKGWTPQKQIQVDFERFLDKQRERVERTLHKMEVRRVARLKRLDQMAQARRNKEADEDECLDHEGFSHRNLPDYDLEIKGVV